MRILAWNVNHRARRRRIPSWLTHAIAAEAADVVSLTEYVVGPDHDRFLSELAGIGLLHTVLTTRVNGSNQVLLAARKTIMAGEIRPGAFHESVAPNFLHARLSDGSLDVIGFRMPAFKNVETPMKRRTWEWLIEALRSLGNRPACIVGDFNTAFGDSKSLCGDCLESFSASGWLPAVPTDGFSWGGAGGRSRRKIDLGFASPGARVESAAYSWAFRDLGEEAAAMRVGRPDHAMLLLQVTVRSK